MGVWGKIEPYVFNCESIAPSSQCTITLRILFKIPQVAFNYEFNIYNIEIYKLFYSFTIKIVSSIRRKCKQKDFINKIFHNF